VLQELDRPSAQRIRQLEVEGRRSAPQFEERYGHGREVPLSDVLWTCTTIFNLSANPKQFQPRIFFFTANDAPCKLPAEQEAAETRAQDLLDLGVDIEFFPLIPLDGVFSIERFWGRVLPVDMADYLEQAAVRVEELERRVRRRLHRKRTLQRITLEVCPGVEVAMSVFVHILEARVPFPVYLLNESNKLLKSETRNICGHTGSILHPADDVETFVELAGERVFISRREIDEVKKIGEPGMKLLGFKPLNFLRPYHRVFHSYFVYPNERAISGSGALCAALIDCLITRKQFALIRYTARRASQPVLAALVPQAEQLEEGGRDQVCPAGFHMILLPWGEDVRRLHFPAPEGVAPPAPVAAELADAAQRVVEAMSLDTFAPGCVENPVLQKHYAAVQALALGEDNPEETPDMLQPDEMALNDKAALLAAWRGAIDVAVPPAPGAGAKRGNADAVPDGTDPRLPKVPRLSGPVAPISKEEMRAMVLSGEVERLTVPALRDWLKSQGVSCSGKKADLCERIRAVM